MATQGGTGRHTRSYLRRRIGAEQGGPFSPRFRWGDWIVPPVCNRVLGRRQFLDQHK